jgi:energy-coupling factor transporter ATP-binding protein EcfA2
MHIRKIHIENVRGFRGGNLAVDLDLRRPDGSLAGWTVLAGRNGSGKTTLLQAIALALLGQSSLIDDDLAGWVHDGEEGAAVTLAVEPGLHGEAQRGVLQDDPVVYSFGWEVDGNSAGVHLDDSNRGDSDCRGSFFAGYGSFRRLSGHTSDAQRVMSTANGASRVVTLFREDASLAEGVQWLREINYRGLEKRPGALALEETALRLLNDGLLPAVQVEKVDSDGLWVKRNGTSLPLARLSDGYRGVTALLLDMLRHLQQAFGELRLVEAEGRLTLPYEGVVLIDEADAHLHVSWQQRIGFWLKQHFPNIQFIVTTHSPFICQAADPKGLICLPEVGEDRRVEHVAESVYHTVVNGAIDDTVLSALFGLESPYSMEAERLRRRVARLEARLQSGSVSDVERTELAELRERLPQSMASDVEQALRRLALAELDLQNPAGSGNLATCLR